jgi:uncharacterized oligopeptide transporter (OPT) family protein
MSVVIFGSLALVIVLAAVPQLGLGLSLEGILGALMILLFGFLFVTVSSRLTGEVGSSSNPISGMTIATLLLTCLIFVLVGKRDVSAMLTSLSVAAVVCIASSNGGTTSQDLKTGYLVYLGLSTATPIFLGGLLRWLTDRRRGVSASEAETETSPGVLFSSGYIAGGTLCGLLIGFLIMLLPKLFAALQWCGQNFGDNYAKGETYSAKIAALVMFLILAAILLWVGVRKTPVDKGTHETPNRSIS